jgi:ribonuclease I
MHYRPSLFSKDYIIPLFINLVFVYTFPYDSKVNYNSEKRNICTNSMTCPLKLALKKCNQSDNWSIHGLWLDYANGSYPQYCSKMDFKPIDNNLINNLNENWYSCNGNNTDFWNHELQKHASCIRDNIFPNLDSNLYFNETIELYNGIDKIKNYFCNNNSNNCMIDLISK